MTSLTWACWSASRLKCFGLKPSMREITLRHQQSLQAYSPLASLAPLAQVRFASGKPSTKPTVSIPLKRVKHALQVLKAAGKVPPVPPRYSALPSKPAFVGTSRASDAAVAAGRLLARLPSSAAPASEAEGTNHLLAKSLESPLDDDGSSASSKPGRNDETELYRSDSNLFLGLTSWAAVLFLWTLAGISVWTVYDPPETLPNWIRLTWIAVAMTFLGYSFFMYSGQANLVRSIVAIAPAAVDSARVVGRGDTMLRITSGSRFVFRKRLITVPAAKVSLRKSAAQSLALYLALLPPKRPLPTSFLSKLTHYTFWAVQRWCSNVWRSILVLHGRPGINHMKIKGVGVFKIDLKGNFRENGRGLDRYLY